MWRDASRLHLFSGRGRDYRSDSTRREWVAALRMVSATVDAQGVV
jgi:hypothetical protein